MDKSGVIVDKSLGKLDGSNGIRTLNANNYTPILTIIANNYKPTTCDETMSVTARMASFSDIPRFAVAWFLSAWRVFNMT